MYKKPSEGGCWFCHQDRKPLLFDVEFDTFVHAECIKKELKENPKNQEALLMKYLLNDKRK